MLTMHTRQVRLCASPAGMRGRCLQAKRMYRPDLS
jgi:hypothetical protein